MTNHPIDLFSDGSERCVMWRNAARAACRLRAPREQA